PRLAALSGDPTAPGVADLLQGRASFGAVMARDRGSRAMVVGAGRDASDIASVVKSPRLKLALDALAHANDHIIIDGGTLGEIPVESLASLARRVILAVPADAADAAREASRLLQEAGIAESAIITAPAKRAREPGSNVPEPQAA
ncbi:MAG: lipopolysaccharide biosynthesis protein, partial [Rhizobiales bacterium]|nr:lipopolysaccharide biosynthesis protein [Hyphomicrobiales bacterium]